MLTSLTEWLPLKSDASERVHIANAKKIKDGDFNWIAGCLPESHTAFIDQTSSASGESYAEVIFAATRLSDLLVSLNGTVEVPTVAHAGQLASVLKKFVKAQPATLGAFIDKLEDLTDENRRVVLTQILANPNALVQAGEIASEKLNDRLELVRASAAGLQTILAEEILGETACQDHLKKPENLWLLGLQYTEIKALTPAARGTMDFLLHRYDGLCDVVELKDPRDAIINGAVGSQDASMPPPSGLAFTPTVANALMQGIAYQNQMTRDWQHMQDEYGFKDTRYPRIIIVVGQKCRLTGSGKKLLDAANRALHGIEIVGYDEIAERGRRIAENFGGLVDSSAAN